MDCDDVMLALANRERTLTATEDVRFHAHLEECDERGRRGIELARSVDGAAFSKDGTCIALGIGNTVQLWTTKDPSRPLFTVSSTPTNSYALSDDGELFATGSLDGQIRIWDSRGRMLDRLVGSQTAITRVQFAGDRLLGQSDDGFSTTWDVHRDTRTRAEIKEFADKYSNWRLVNVQIVPKL